jgi:hypothetical protein
MIRSALSLGEPIMTTIAYKTDRRPNFAFGMKMALLPLCIAFTPSMAPAQTSKADEAAVRSVMDGYITASRDADEMAARALFHPNAIMTGVTAGGKMGYGTPEGFFTLLGKLAAGPKAAYGPAKVTQISVAGDIATGTVEESDFNGKRYTDMFQLVRENGHWLIISKVWYGIPLK